MNTGQQIVLFLSLVLLILVVLCPFWVIEYPSSPGMEGRGRGASASAIQNLEPERVHTIMGRSFIFSPPEIDTDLRNKYGIVVHLSQISVYPDTPRTAVEVAAVALGAAMLVGVLAPVRKRRQQPSKAD